MVTQYAQLVWLKLRHAKALFIRIMYMTGTDFAGDTNFTDRSYQVYVLLAAIGAVALTWLGVLDVVSSTFVTLGAPVAEAVFASLILLPVTVLPLFVVSSLRSSPIKLSHADISYIATSPVSVVVILHVELISALLPYGALGFIPGYFLTAGVQAVIPSVAPLSSAILLGLALLVVGFASWLPGLLRLFFRPFLSRALSALALLTALCPMALLFVYYFAQPLEFSLMLSIFNAFFVDIVLILVAVLIIVLVLLTVVASRLSATVLIEKNALYAELYSLRHLQFFDPNTYRLLSRRRKLSLRGPVIVLQGSVPQNLISRAVLSHVRQYEALVNIALMGFVAVPLGVLLLTSELSIMFFLLWTASLLGSSVGQRELTMVFRDDQRNRMLRDHLPFTTPMLLFMDSLPAALLASFASLATLCLLIPVSMHLLYCILYALLIIAAVIICTGLDHVQLSSRVSANVNGWRFSYELSFLLFSLGTMALSILNITLGVLAALLILVSYLQLLKQGRE